MMLKTKMKLAFTVALTAVLFSPGVSAQAVSISNVSEFNALLPSWGVSWAPGKGSVNGYYPTFYTGFAMRSAFPERIHVRTSRGNQTRLSVILDETTVSDYLFDLVKRRDFYNRMTSGSGAPLDVSPSGGKLLPQLSMFNQIIDSPVYGIASFVERGSRGLETPETIYAKGLETLTALNPGRVFHLKIDLQTEFAKWRAEMRKRSGGDVSRILSNSNQVVAAINGLVFGRVNYTAKPSDQILGQLKTALELGFQGGNEQAFTAAAFELFKSATGSKYQIRVLAPNGQFMPALQCNTQSCTLTYPEFTAIYPTGSAMSSTRDEFGNTINQFATPGLWQFLNYPGREVDNIRDEPYYGFIPKMDFEGIGNGFHNPAVRFWGVSSAVKAALGIASEHNTLWAVKRGDVSHGCLRLPVGHMWELRQIFPVENSQMTKVQFFGSNSQDFDLYDIDGNGTLEVMGVQYMISYGLQGTDGLARREGTGLEINEDRKNEFYTKLYGAKNVFTVQNGSQYFFENPKVSVPSYLDFKKKKVSTRVELQGSYPLYEQRYEKDKVQFYSVGSMSKDKKLVVRLMGRVRGCAPSTDKVACGEAAFDQEARKLVR